jgi:hypothetical protein
MDRKIALHSGLITVIIGSVITIAVIRSNRSEPILTATKKMEKRTPEARLPNTRVEPDSSSSPRPVENPSKQAAALHDATLLGLIENARMAQQRGDAVTRDAMLAGLKKEPERSKELIRQELTAAQDQAVAAALQHLMENLQ